MKNRLKIGDKRVFTHTVTAEDMASFDAGTVHTVCSTFALAKYIEWASRLFIVDIKAEDEEGIGTVLSIKHISPAFEREELQFEATVSSIIKNELLCEVKVSCKSRTIATAQTGQKLLKKEKIKEIFSSLADS
ncbi:MAG: hypothetical protein L3J06_03480 [Cyclobacteriaceae bacterium]|nr:hypothetical protein [Cyclobacteriaceae bacterium]